MRYKCTDNNFSYDKDARTFKFTLPQASTPPRPQTCWPTSRNYWCRNTEVIACLPRTIYTASWFHSDPPSKPEAPLLGAESHFPLRKTRLCGVIFDSNTHQLLSRAIKWSKMLSDPTGSSWRCLRNMSEKVNQALLDNEWQLYCQPEEACSLL